MDGSKDSMESDSSRKLYKDCIDAIRISLETLVFIKDNSPTDGMIRGRAEKTIQEIERLLKLDE